MSRVEISDERHRNEQHSGQKNCRAGHELAADSKAEPRGERAKHHQHRLRNPLPNSEDPKQNEVKAARSGKCEVIEISVDGLPVKHAGRVLQINRLIAGRNARDPRQPEGF